MNIMSSMLPSDLPEFLYKYTSVARALEVLLTGEVYFSHRRELNDPFDGKQTLDLSTCEKIKEAIKLANLELKEHEEKGHDMSIILSGRSREEHQDRLVEDNDYTNSQVQKLAEDIEDADNMGIYCFSRENDSIIMWAHYANNHQGCCLEFNFQEHEFRSVEKGKFCFPFSFLHSVKYSDKYPTPTFGEESVPHQGTNSYMCKSKDWKYENEWRALMYDKRVRSPISGKSIGSKIVDEPIINRMKGSGHYPLDKDLLHGIILGYKMKDNEKKSIINAALLRGIKIYEAQPKLYEYGMEIKPWDNFVLAK